MTDEQKNNHDCPMCSNVNGWNCHRGLGHKHFVLRCVLGILILICIFSFGMLVGELKGELRSEYSLGGYWPHSYMMRSGYNTPYFNMMGWQAYNYPVSPALQQPVTPTKK